MRSRDSENADERHDQQKSCIDDGAIASLSGMRQDSSGSTSIPHEQEDLFRRMPEVQGVKFLPIIG